MSKNLILGYSTPPSNDDLQALAESLVGGLPKELDDLCENLEIMIDHFPTQDVIDEFELDTDFDLLALYRDFDKTLTLYRRPILDLWCDSEDDLTDLTRHLMITELAQQLGLSASEIENLANQS